MNRFITNVFIALSLLGGAEIYAANEESITIPLSENDNKGDGYKKEIPSRGNRSLRAPVLCTLNFADGTVELTASQEIISYEVWDAEGDCIVASFATGSAMVEFLSTASGCYQLRLVTDDYSYEGYLEL